MLVRGYGKKYSLFTSVTSIYRSCYVIKRLRDLGIFIPVTLILLLSLPEVLSSASDAVETVLDEVGDWEGGSIVGCGWDEGGGKGTGSLSESESRRDFKFVNKQTKNKKNIIK